MMNNSLQVLGRQGDTIRGEGHTEKSAPQSRQDEDQTESYLRLMVNCCSFDFNKSPTENVA